MTFRHSQLVTLLRKGSLKEIKAYVQDHPESVTAKDERTGRIALHYAVEESNKGDDDEKLAKLSFLLLSNLKGVTEKDREGRLPLHVFAAEQRTFRPALLRLLLTLYGGATSVRDVDGSFPLHLAMASRQFDTSTVLLQKHVGTVDATATHSFEPLLHTALLCGAPHHFLLLLVERAPDCAFMTNSAGDLPLSTALRMQVRLEGLQIVLEAHPSALRVPRPNGELPLHYEARHGWRHQVLRLLIDRYEEGLARTDGSGRLPLGCAVENNRVSNASWHLLYEKYPPGLTQASWSGTTPLGIACRWDYRYETAQWILAQRPALVRQTVDKHGNLPVHVAAAATSSSNAFDILRLLVQLDPGSLLMGNYEGSLPLHSALSTKTNQAELSLDKVRYLLERCPEAASRPDHCGQLPLHAACRFRQRVDVVDLLIQSHPKALSMYDADGYLPFHHACLLADDDDKFSFLRRLIAKLEGPTLPPTRDGVPPLLLACEQNVALNVVHFLVQHSLELFAGTVRVAS